MTTHPTDAQLTEWLVLAEKLEQDFCEFHEAEAAMNAAQSCWPATIRALQETRAALREYERYHAVMWNLAPSRKDAPWNGRENELSCPCDLCVKARALLGEEAKL